MSAEDVSEDAQNFYPLYAKPGINEGVLWQFQDEDRITTINDSSGQIKAILERSNGHNSVNEIFEDCERAGVKTDRIESVMRDLRRLGIIVDSRELGIEMHGYTNNPQAFTRPLTNQDVLDITFNDTYLPKSGSEYSPGTTTSNTLDLSKMRESCRNFLPIAIDSKGIMTCLQSSYSAEHHPVPSAGGLYPLRMYLIQKIGSPELPEGLYQYDHTNHHLIRIDEEVDEIDLSYVFGSEDLLHNAPTVVVIAAALDRHNSKYANRGYRYTLLEAGHSAQNIHITAQELGISTL
ncbi:MAG TPA: SagB/ThcOx family dehydrogenase, partial [Candidatus Saccharimonadales bacterium]|nr:SagB/ThcOx family dehydrogenase [Candidatus Saccharimonadales bacterium]